MTCVFADAAKQRITDNGQLTKYSIIPLDFRFLLPYRIDRDFTVVTRRLPPVNLLAILLRPQFAARKHGSLSAIGLAWEFVVVHRCTGTAPDVAELERQAGRPDPRPLGTGNR